MHDRDFATVLQAEAADVDRIAEGMFGEPRARIAVDAAATIGAEGLDFDDALVEARLRLGLERRP